ncbi:hypothetical protein LshimejAT787_0302540 [Lyophyllum shimeji]|uniref:Uncharacterized protein n=1 Tax=Lyophyllum shimeji TaxID=47721 RepID=A0A9P3UM41_LYOSH|nr:hypothetical protein LshimejAT787_0302540 [Lyophyllum shimeji]
MHATRPRSSILHLFDPLASPAQSRDTPSPDSDKENSCPAFAEAFFDPAIKHSSPVVLKRRLVDVGDVTVDDPSTLAMLTEEEELDGSMCVDDNDTLTLPPFPTVTPARAGVSQVEGRTPTNSTVRTPLGELALDQDITPVARTKVYRRQPPLPSVITPASDDSSLSSVVDTVNSSGASFAGPASVKSSLNYHELINEDHAPPDTETPQITISSADELSESLSTLNLATPAGTLVTDISRPFASTPLCPASEVSPVRLSARLRPNPPDTSAQDPNRRSVDLYASFHLQLQSEEASFDLLNDKISFFASASGTDSFLNAIDEDDSFDMAVEEKNLQRAVETMRQEENLGKSTVCAHAGCLILIGYDTGPKVSAGDVRPPEPEPGPSITPPPAVSTASGEDTKSKTSPGPSLHGTSSSNSPASPTFLFGQRKQLAKVAPSEETTAGSSASPAVFVSPSPPSPDQHALAQAGVHTPLSVVREALPPPPVPALRIVKRIKRPGLEKTTSSTSASFTAAARGIGESKESSRVPTLDSAEAGPAPPPETRQKSALAAGAGRMASAGRVTAPAPTIALPSLSSSGSGPRRVPIVDSQASTASSRTGLGNQRVLPLTNGTGPRRVMIAPSVQATATAAPSKVPAVSGLKAPVRYGAGPGTAASALPRPVSRLPAPSGGGSVRPRPAAAAGTGIASGVGSQRAAGRAVLPRRMAYGTQ